MLAPGCADEALGQTVGGVGARTTCMCNALEQAVQPLPAGMVPKILRGRTCICRHRLVRMLGASFSQLRCLVPKILPLKISNRMFKYMHGVLNGIYLQNFLHGWVVNHETDLMSLLNS